MIKLYDSNHQYQFDEALLSALERTVFRGKSATDKEVNQWIEDHSEDLRIEIEGFLKEAVSRILKPKPVVTKPVLCLHTKGEDGIRNTISVYVCDSGQACVTGQHRSFRFGGDDTASLIYSERSINGHNDVEHNIDNASTWEWIQKWMCEGFKSAGYLDKSKHDPETGQPILLPQP